MESDRSRQRLASSSPPTLEDLDKRMVRHLFAHPYHNLHLWQQRDKGYIPVPTLFEDNKRKGRLGTRDPFAEVGSTQRYSCGGMCYEISENFYDELIDAGYNIWRVPAAVVRCGLDEIDRGLGPNQIENHNVLLVSLPAASAGSTGLGKPEQNSLYLADVGFANGSTKGPVSASAVCREEEFLRVLSRGRERGEGQTEIFNGLEKFTGQVRGDAWCLCEHQGYCYVLLWRAQVKSWLALYRFEMRFLSGPPQVQEQDKLRDDHYTRLVGDPSHTFLIRDRFIRVVGFSKQLRAMINFEFDLHTKKHSNQVIDFETSQLKHSVVFGSFHEGMQTVQKLGLLDSALEHGVVDPDYILNPSTIPECRCGDCFVERRQLLSRTTFSFSKSPLIAKSRL
jgi:hypothetical protein